MDDPYDLNRFVRAQHADYERALSEITGGQKRTHWMWYIFPQVYGLGSSSTLKYYAIRSPEEARHTSIIRSSERGCWHALRRPQGQTPV